MAWRGLLVSGLAGLGFQAAAVGVPLLVQRTLDDGVVTGNQAATLYWSGALVALALLGMASEMVMAWYETLSANLAGNRLHVRLVAHVLELDRESVDRFGAGDLAMRGTRDIDVIRVWLTGVPSLVSGVVGFTAMIVAIGLMHPLLLLVAVVTVVAVLVANAYYPARFRAADRELSAAHGTRADAVENLLTATVAVRGVGAERILVDQHREPSAAVTAHTVRVGGIGASWAATGLLIPGLATAAGLVIGGAAVLDGGMTIGQLVAFASWMGMIAMWVGVITMRLNQLAAARVAGVRVREVLETRARIADPDAEPVDLPSEGVLEAREVAVAGDGRWQLRPSDLVVAPGEMVALVGPTGCGKSTLLRVLARFEDPSGGRVVYGGTDLRTVAVARLRERITLVAQRPTVVSGTVYENLRLGRDDVTDAMIEAACRLAALHDHIAGLPDGYDTAVGQGGSTLSGGQVQRLALARGILRGASVLLLDDVTSAVDVPTERQIVDGLRRWLDGGGPAELPPPRAVVVAGHRSAVLDAADRHVRPGTRDAAVGAGGSDG